MSRFRILSIDGGGIKGVFPAAFLAAIENQIEDQIYKYFDLIAGTSTGGIIALGLGLGLSATQLAELYVDRGARIFPVSRRTRWAKLQNFFSRSKYSSEPLFSALREVFGESKLGDSRVPLLIPTLSGISGKIHVYKTPHQPRLEMDWKTSAIDVALATSAAPTYLPPHISPQGVPFLDGGLWANNPTGMAVVEAIVNLSADRSDIEVLSLGCTAEPKDFSAVGGAQIRWARLALEAAMTGQTFASMGTAALLVGHDHITRINPTVAPGRFSLDDTSGIQNLYAFGYEEARNEIPILRERFFLDVARPYKPQHPVAAPTSRVGEHLAQTASTPTQSYVADTTNGSGAPRVCRS